MNKKYSIDKESAQIPYISPDLKVIEMTARNAILESSPGSNLEGGNSPSRPGW